MNTEIQGGIWETKGKGILKQATELDLQYLKENNSNNNILYF